MKLEIFTAQIKVGFNNIHNLFFSLKDTLKAFDDIKNKQQK